MGGQGSGGANGGPQYSPMNISPTGGNGQSGTQAATYIPGLPYGQGKETLNMQKSAKMAGNPLADIVGNNATPVTPITAPTEQANVPVTNGAAVGAGAGTEALNLPKNADNSEDVQRLRSYLPALEVAAAQPNASQSFKNYVRLLKANIQ
jgi:hypothetical protein